jgi:hypothetical protein
VFITSSAATVTSEFFTAVASEIFQEVCARQLRRGAVGFGSPQAIDIV